jgi:non-ribosomal peptide synthetase component E (peptide arylation enzyme)
VIAIPDEKWSERPLACVVAKPGQAPTAAELAMHLMQMGFAKWQVPDRYEWLAAVPRTSTGKFYKLKLRDLGYRLVYEVIDQRLIVLVIAIGRRDHDEAYQIAVKRTK